MYIQPCRYLFIRQQWLVSVETQYSSTENKWKVHYQQHLFCILPPLVTLKES